LTLLCGPAYCPSVLPYMTHRPHRSMTRYEPTGLDTPPSRAPAEEPGFQGLRLPEGTKDCFRPTHARGPAPVPPGAPMPENPHGYRDSRTSRPPAPSRPRHAIQVRRRRIFLAAFRPESPAGVPYSRFALAPLRPHMARIQHGYRLYGRFATPMHIWGPMSRNFFRLLLGRPMAPAPARHPPAALPWWAQARSNTGFPADSRPRSTSWGRCQENFSASSGASVRPTRRPPAPYACVDARSYPACSTTFCARCAGSSSYRTSSIV
jgi:hypothetical protein